MMMLVPPFRHCKANPFIVYGNITRKRVVGVILIAKFIPKIIQFGTTGYSLSYEITWSSTNPATPANHWFLEFLVNILTQGIKSRIINKCKYKEQDTRFWDRCDVYYIPCPFMWHILMMTVLEWSKSWAIGKTLVCDTREIPKLLGVVRLNFKFAEESPLALFFP